MSHPDAAYVHQHLRSIVIHSLDTFNYNNAEFACERLLASDSQNLDFLYLYCLTLFRKGRFTAVFNKLTESGQNPAHLGCAYILARLCLELAKFKEGIYAILRVAYLYNDLQTAGFGVVDQSVASGHKDGPSGKKNGLSASIFNYETHRSIYPDNSAVYHLLGDLYKSLGDTRNSALNYAEALRYNQFDFEAFQELAKLGAGVKIRNIYQDRKEIQAADIQPSRPDYGVSNPFAENSRKDIFANQTPQAVRLIVPDAPLRKAPDREFSKPEQKGRLERLTSRFSPKTHADVSKRHAQGIKRQSAGIHGPVLPDNDGMTFVQSSEIAAAAAHLRYLYSIFARGFKSLAKYDCYKAIRVLESLPEAERDTPWVLSKLGRLHYEIVNYRQLEHFFIRLRKLDRTRLEDMEYYSTLLWHLHKRVELTYLAHEVHGVDDKLAVTWCVIGNLFSLCREPDEAIKCFNRAVKLDNKFTYAYTLKGHEYFGNDNYELALENFRVSLLLDSRHYNALYGIGMVYINLGDYQRADYHFRKAVAVNPVNIILLCCVGMVLEKTGKRQLALRQYELAHKLHPLSALPIFKKAQLLFSMQQFPQALAQFEIVKDLAPNEASVHFLLGQLYNIQGDKFQAIREFTIALNLDPKGNYLIREAMEALKK